MTVFTDFIASLSLSLFLVTPISVQQPDDQRAEAPGCGEDRGRVERLRPGNQTLSDSGAGGGHGRCRRHRRRHSRKRYGSVETKVLLRQSRRRCMTLTSSSSSSSLPDPHTELWGAPAVRGRRSVLCLKSGWEAPPPLLLSAPWGTAHWATANRGWKAGTARSSSPSGTVSLYTAWVMRMYKF